MDIPSPLRNTSLSTAPRKKVFISLALGGQSGVAPPQNTSEYSFVGAPCSGHPLLRDMDTSYGSLYLASQQSLLQQRLHVATAICNQQNIDTLIPDSVDDAVRFEEDLAVFMN